MNITENNVKDYIEGFLNSIFKQNIKIDIKQNFYIVNNTSKMPMYKFWEKNSATLLLEFDNNLFGQDYIGTIFFFLSGYWEFINNDKKDKYGRFLAEKSFSFKKGILEEPIVDILLNELSKQLNLEYKNFFNMPKIFLTHDIDFLGMVGGMNLLKSMLGDIIKRKSIKLAMEKIKAKFKKRDPHSVLNLIDIHKKYKSKGTYFFMADIQPKEAVGGYNSLQQRNKLKELKKQILNSDGSIGIHYDVRYLNKDKLYNDIQVLENVLDMRIKSGRAHYLIFDIARSFDVIEKSGIKIDTTCSYPDMIGFRFGTSYPFKPYNFKQCKPYTFTEIPLIIMDTTLQSYKYMNFSPEEGIKKIKKLMAKVKMYNGIFTILWHNTSFYTKTWKEWEPVYEECIRCGIKNNYEFINVEDVGDNFD